MKTSIDLNWRSWAWVFIVVFAAAFAFALFTQHAWDDYWITYRASKNLATGNGLVFTAGQRVHSFTSPLGTLLPAALGFLTGNRSDVLVLWLFRIVSSMALGGAAVLVWKIAAADGMGRLASIALIGLLATDAKTLDYSINGMEAALLVLFLAMVLHAHVVPGPQATLRLGCAWAGLMWTRPDGFVYAGALGVAFLLFRKERGWAGAQTDFLKRCLRAGAVAMCLYLPWVLWAWFYYGSPVPHTIIAKGLSMVKTAGLGRMMHGVELSLLVTFLPAYVMFGGWPFDLLYWYGMGLAFLCAVYWLLPSGRPLGRALSFAFLAVQVYLGCFCPIIYPWYLVGVAFLGLWVLAEMLQQCVDVARHMTWLPRAVACLLLGGTLALTLCVAWQLRVQQQVVENGNRKQIGLWLKANAASPKDSVFCEPLGYIGFFSQLKMYDYPGLSSPEVVAARRQLGTDDWDKLICYLRPDWLVLRPNEARQLRERHESLLTKDYSLVRTFDVSERLKTYDWLPGMGYLLFDQSFVVFRRH
ncbi:MAG: hypothetical protein WA117_05080 [Verrucomicrobiia bacterium]